MNDEIDVEIVNFEDKNYISIDDFYKIMIGYLNYIKNLNDTDKKEKKAAMLTINDLIKDFERVRKINK